MWTAELKQALRTMIRFGVANIREILGAESRYCIRGAYRHNIKTCYFDDTSFADEYQKEVYLYAADIGVKDSIKSVYDVGCGSGYKLLTYLGQYDTTGFDLPETVEFLQRKYPDRKWVMASFSDLTISSADLVICSDVIEHVLDPDELMGFLVRVSKKWLVLSTPDRFREYPRWSRFQLGPPHTDHHVREWAFSEFRCYSAPI